MSSSRKTRAAADETASGARRRAGSASRARTTAPAAATPRRPSAYDDYDDGFSYRSAPSYDDDDYYGYDGYGSSRAPRAAKVTPAAASRASTGAKSASAAKTPASAAKTARSAPAAAPAATAATTTAAAAEPAARRASTRAAPGENLDVGRRRLAFSDRPCEANVPWRGATHAFNKRIFCAAVGRVAEAHARAAAESLWDMNPPTTDAALDRFLQAAVVRITVCEGLDLIEAANAVLDESTPGRKGKVYK
ncbi:tegument protein VP22 [Suid alphaherpesvirus 1]|uniref:Tegument protein VP22 n=1 Tax=Suid herpesvirus 1 TaxID=10345 RepID=A0A0S2MLW5_SUHV|nr:tegument protein VP22 [Suid alphaherpesvirus 1]ALO75743.1 tegument protein VP22 [Suid alphaherpesvirus 1]